MPVECDWAATVGTMSGTLLRGRRKRHFGVATVKRDEEGVTVKMLVEPNVVRVVACLQDRAQASSCHRMAEKGAVAPPGWYPDPGDSGGERYWAGPADDPSPRALCIGSESIDLLDEHRSQGSKDGARLEDLNSVRVDESGGKSSLAMVRDSAPESLCEVRPDDVRAIQELASEAHSSARQSALSQPDRIARDEDVDRSPNLSTTQSDAGWRCDLVRHWADRPPNRPRPSRRPPTAFSSVRSAVGGG